MAGVAAEDRLVPLVVELTTMVGPSGYEHDVQSWLEARWRAAGCETRRNRVGNLFAKVGGSGPRLLFAAHADEIAFLVKSVHPNGHLLLTTNTLGSELLYPNPFVVAHPFVVVTRRGHLPGVIGAMTGHVMTRTQRESRTLDWPDIFVDIGARSRDEALAWGVRVGDPVVAATPTRRVGHNLVGKAMDDRAALAIMTLLAETLEREALAYELWFVSTVQEEIGLVGADSVTGFDLAIALEVGLAGDIPPIDPLHLPAVLGGGPLIGHKDAQVHYDVDLIHRLDDCAAAAGIPVQHLVFPQFSSDGRRFMGNDIPTALLAYPTRYTHTPAETVDVHDLLGMVDLLAAFACRPPPAKEVSARSGQA
jgi:tetrahedral aminopeptidase